MNEWNQDEEIITQALIFIETGETGSGLSALLARDPLLAETLLARARKLLADVSALRLEAPSARALARAKGLVPAPNPAPVQALGQSLQASRRAVGRMWRTLTARSADAPEFSLGVRSSSPERAQRFFSVEGHDIDLASTRSGGLMGQVLTTDPGAAPFVGTCTVASPLLEVPDEEQGAEPVKGPEAASRADAAPPQRMTPLTVEIDALGEFVVPGPLPSVVTLLLECEQPGGEAPADSTHDAPEVSLRIVLPRIELARVELAR